jgi:ComF family protein
MAAAWQGVEKPDVRRILRRLVDVLIPPHCLACHAPTLEPAAMCPNCWRKLRLIEAPCCDVLGTPFAYDQGEGAVSPAALAEPPPWNRARAAVAYGDAAGTLVHALKYRDRHEAALIMARLMTRAGASLLADADAVVPVPLHRLRLWTRRYNQSSLLAQRIAGLSGRPYRPEFLVRSRATPRQVGLDHDKRRRNVRGAFRVPDEVRGTVTGSRLLLVDDVLTTGATAGACAKALKRAGAARVDVLVFALVLEPKALHI